MQNLDILKKKIIYRSERRSSKEMDLLLSSFVKKYINSFVDYELEELDNLLNIEDEILYKWHFNQENNSLIPNNKVTEKLKKFKL